MERSKNLEDANQRISEMTCKGRLIQNSGPVTCKKCGGDRGWIKKNGVLTHTFCGAVQ